LRDFPTFGLNTSHLDLAQLDRSVGALALDQKVADSPDKKYTSTQILNSMALFLNFCTKIDHFIPTHKSSKPVCKMNFLFTVFLSTRDDYLDPKKYNSNRYVKNNNVAHKPSQMSTEQI